MKAKDFLDVNELMRYELHLALEEVARQIIRISESESTDGLVGLSRAAVFLASDVIRVSNEIANAEVSNDG